MAAYSKFHRPCRYLWSAQTPYCTIDVHAGSCHAGGCRQGGMSWQLASAGQQLFSSVGARSKKASACQFCTATSSAINLHIVQTIQPEMFVITVLAGCSTILLCMADDHPSYGVPSCTAPSAPEVLADARQSLVYVIASMQRLYSAMSSQSVLSAHGRNLTVPLELVLRTSAPNLAAAAPDQQRQDDDNHHDCDHDACVTT